MGNGHDTGLHGLAPETVRSLLRHPVWRNADPGEGAGLAVLLVPGFGASNISVDLTATWLRDRGYGPADAHIGLNLGCTTELVDRIEQRLEQHANATGGRAVLLGQSRGDRSPASPPCAAQTWCAA